MAQLDKKTIDAIGKISEAIEGTGFYLNRFSVSDKLRYQIAIYMILF